MTESVSQLQAISLKPRRVLLLGATFDTGNLGVGALAAGAIQAIRASYSDAEIRFLDYGRSARVDIADSGGEPVAVPLINLRFSWKLLLRNNIFLLIALAGLLKIAGEPLRSKILRRNPWLCQIDAADLAVAISGGDSFSDIYGFERFLYVLLPQLLVVLLEKPLILLPQTLGPFKGKMARRLARRVAGKALYVFSRERCGILEAQDLLGAPDRRERARFCYDLGFVVNPRAPDALMCEGIDLAARGSGLLVGVNVSGLLYIGGYRKDMFGLATNYRDLVFEIVRFLIEAQGATVLLVPHVFGYHAESDVHAVSSVFDQLGRRYRGRLGRVNGAYDQHEMKYIIGACDFFVGSRMHACIAALSQTVPALGIAYSDKFRGVFESVGAGHLVADARDLGSASMLKLLQLRLQEREKIRDHMREIMPEVRKTVLGLLTEASR